MDQPPRRLLVQISASPQNFGIIEFREDLLYAGPYVPSAAGPVPMTFHETFYHRDEFEALQELLSMTKVKA